MNSKKNFTVIVASLLLLGVVPSFMSTVLFALPTSYGETFLGELPYKCARLDETGHNKIVVVGGSGVAFSLNSSLLEQQFSTFTPVNFGLYAGLGSKAMLELSRPSIRKGDIVVLSFEQEKQSLSTYFNSDAMWQALDGAKGLSSRLSSDERAALFGASFPFASGKANLSFTGTSLAGEGVYKRSSFNAYGDIENPECDYNHMLGLYDSHMPLLFTDDIVSSDFVTTLNDYADALTHDGAEVYYRFPAMNALAVSSDADIDAYFLSFQKKLHFPIIGNPHQSIMDPAWFYDTNFHLNQSGAIVNTYYLIKDLKAQKGIATPTAIALPEKPSIPERPSSEGDNRDEAAFTYSQEAGINAISGLSEEGKTRTNLCLPYSHGGEVYSALRKTTFANDAFIESLTIQDNIKTIDDASFFGTTALKKIILLPKNPRNFSVGRSLLDKTSANLYVPKDSLSAYRIDYFFSQYADRIFAAD